MVNDALDPDVAGEVINGHRPDIVVLVAGATPTMAPLDEQTWDEFSGQLGDRRQAHSFVAIAVLRTPLRPGSRTIVVSSGAAIAGSPLSGGYAGAKATQRFLTGYAQDESDRRGLGITFTAVLPRITPLTHVGAVASQAYAARDGISQADYAAQFGEALSPEAFGTAIRTLAQLERRTLAGASCSPRPASSSSPELYPTRKGKGNMVDILHRVGARNSSPEAAYAALTTIDGLAGWWARDTQGDPGSAA